MFKTILHANIITPFLMFPAYAIPRPVKTTEIISATFIFLLSMIKPLMPPV